MRPRRRSRNFAGLVKEALPATAKGKPIEIRFQDEPRVGRKGAQTRMRARIGSKSRAPRDTRYKWVYLFGAVHAVLVLDGAGRHTSNP